MKKCLFLTLLFLFMVFEGIGYSYQEDDSYNEGYEKGYSYDEDNNFNMMIAPPAPPSIVMPGENPYAKGVIDGYNRRNKNNSKNNLDLTL